MQKLIYVQKLYEAMEASEAIIKLIERLAERTDDTKISEISQIKLLATRIHESACNAVPSCEGRFKVHERFNGFEVEDTQSHRFHWLSDGVDAVHNPYPDTSPDEDNDNDEMLTAGGGLFCQLWSEQLNADEDETFEAYFSQPHIKPDSRMCQFLSNVKLRIESSKSGQTPTLQHAMDLAGDSGWTTVYQLARMEYDKPEEFSGVTKVHQFVERLLEVLNSFESPDYPIESYLEEMGEHCTT